MATIRDLTAIEIDRRLFERAPLSFCQYHQVLPLAREGDRVSVAMVYPHNAAAVAILAELFDAQIVPVQTSAADLHTIFAALVTTDPAEAPHVLLQAEATDEHSLLVRLAYQLAAEEATECVRLDSSDVGAVTVLAMASATRCKLTSLPMPSPDERANLVLRSTTSILLASTAYPPLRRVLVVLRGQGADRRALLWSAALAIAEQAELVLLVLTDSGHFDLHDLLNRESEPGRYLVDAVEVVTSRGIEPTLRIRPDNSSREIVAELTARPYDMLVISAESHGKFAASVVELFQESAVNLRALLVCKPNRIALAARPFRSNKRRLHRS